MTTSHLRTQTSSSSMRANPGQVGSSPVPLNSTRVSQEVSIVSIQPKCLHHQRTTSAPQSRLENDIVQSDMHSSHSLRSTLNCTCLNSSSPFGNSSRASLSSRRQASSHGLAKMERDGDSVKDLAAFLKHRPPPPENYMSIPDNFDKESPPRRLPFKLFHRHNSKKGPSAPRPMRLPDSAVAQKTTSGQWHIAIAIPLEPDPAPEPTPPSSGFRPIPPITVLKPIMEVHELPKPISTDDIAGARNSSNQQARRTQSFSSPINAEDTRALQNYYRQQSLQDLASKSNSFKGESSKTASQREAVPAQTESARSSQLTDYRNSAGTVYSESSLLRNSTHSRGPSSASSAPSTAHNNRASMKGSETGFRLSSLGKRPEEGPNAVRPWSVIAPSNASITSPSVAESISSDISSVQLAKADTAQTYNTSDVAGVHVNSTRKVSRMPGPAPTRKLPDLPEGTDEFRSRSRSESRSLQGTPEPQKFSSFASNIPLPSGGDSPLDSPTLPTFPQDQINKSPRQARKDKVKALRTRDMASLKAKTNYQQVIAANLAKGNRNTGDSPKSIRTRRATLPSRQGVKKQVSGTLEDAEAESTSNNALSPIMTVASILPPLDSKGSSIYHLPMPSPTLRSNMKDPSTHIHNTRRSSTIRSSIERASTPPRSVTPSLASSDDDAMHLPRRPSTVHSVRTQPPGSVRSVSTHPSNSASGKASVGGRNEEIEARLKRIERSNTVLVQTLIGLMQMGVGLRELVKIVPASSVAGTDPSGGEKGIMEVLGTMMNARSKEMPSSAGSGVRPSSGATVKSGLGVDELEPLMRELQRAATAAHNAGVSGNGNEVVAEVVRALP